MHLVVDESSFQLDSSVGHHVVHRPLVKLQLKEERFEGIEKMPEAFCGLFRGENFGRRVVQVSPDA